MHRIRTVGRNRRRVVAGAGLWLAGAAAIAAAAAPAPAVMNPAPTPADWVAISKLPDWSGYWIPNIRDQTQQETSNTPPWNEKVAREMARARADEKAGKPWGLFANCLPEGLPSGILVNHVGMEWVFSPGRVLMLGDGDGNKLRRIYTDGRSHTPDPNPTLYGESIGHWEGETLVVDTTAILPQAIVAINEAIGVPNDGDMHVVERIHLAGPDTMHDELTITAPKILTKPWKTTRNVILRLQGTAADGGGEQLWTLEFPAPAQISRNGWTHSTLKAGDKVKVELHPFKSGRPGGAFMNATLPNGEKIGR